MTTTWCPSCGHTFIRRTAVASAVALSLHRHTYHPEEYPMPTVPVAYQEDERAHQFDVDVTAERARHPEKGYDAAHDDKVGIDHLLTWAERYLAHEEDVKAGAMIRASRAYIARHHDPRDAYEHGYHAGANMEDRTSAALNALPADQVYGAWFIRLSGLPTGSVVLDADGDAWQKRDEGQWLCVVRTTNDIVDSSALAISTPLTVIHEAKAQHWRWTCAACDKTGPADDLAGLADANDHAATHTSGPFDVLPDIRMDLIKDDVA